MRISTAMFYRQGVTSITEAQSAVVRTQSQLASGQRLLSPADDPVAAARILELDAAIEQNNQYLRNSNMARNRLSLEEQVLSDVENVLFRIRDLAVQANNDTQNPETRSYIAAEATEALEQLVQLANTRDAEGNYIFSGFKARTQPFARDAGGVRYDGDEGQRTIKISDTRNVPDGDNGDAVFMSIPNGSGRFAVDANPANSGTGILGARTLVDPTQCDDGSYTIRFTATDAYEIVDGGGATIATGPWADGDTIDVRGVAVVLSGAPAVGDEFTVTASTEQDMFTTVQSFIDALDYPTNPAGIARAHNNIGSAIENIDRSVDNLLEVRTRVGTRLQTIDSQQASSEDYDITLQATRAELQELDYAEAVTRLNQQLVGLEAAQQSFVRIQGLSLFNLIR